MPLTAYEKFKVSDGKEVLVRGKVKFNCLNHQYTPKPNEIEDNPSPRTAIEIVNPVFYGDKSLAMALHSKMYGETKEDTPDRISLINKGTFLPSMFDLTGEEKAADELIPDGKKLADDQDVMVHVRSFVGKQNNIGASFDGVKFNVPFDQVKFENVGISANVFDDLGEQVTFN